MRTLTSELHDAFQDPERYGFVLLTFTMGDTIYGLWTGQSEITYNSILYKGGGSVIDVEGIEDAGDGSVGEITLSLSEDPDKGLSVDVLQSFYDTDWHMQSLVIETGMRSPSTGLPIGTTVIHDGVMAQAPLKRSKSGGFRIELRSIARTYKLSEQGGKYRNSQTQVLLDPTDTSLTDIGIYGTTQQKELKWGQ